jgi:flagellar hook-associated protein 3 FlgL
MRISDANRYDALAQSLAKAQARQLDASRQASTGARINAPSDDPVAAAQAIRVQASLSLTGDYRATISKVQGDVELAESTLSHATDLMSRAHDIALQGGSGNTTTAGRKALAGELQGIREQLLAAANQKGSLGYLFGGTANQTAPFAADGTFIGNDDQRSIEVAPGISTVVSTSGASAFTIAGGSDVFATLQTLEDALNADDVSAAAATVSVLDTGERQIVAARIDAGNKAARLSVADSAHSETEVSLQEMQHGLVDADLPSAYSKLAQTQQALEAGYSVSRQILDLLQRNLLS